mgnify:CR=1 FL=1
MAQKVMIDGTYYDLKPSPVLIDGTKYQIGGGRTLVDGTGYDIKLKSGWTWLWNADLSSLGRDYSMGVNIPFESNGIEYVRMTVFGPSTGSAASVNYWTNLSAPTKVYYFGWSNQAFRTITFYEEPTGDLLNLLNKYATEI